MFYTGERLFLGKNLILYEDKLKDWRIL